MPKFSKFTLYIEMGNDACKNRYDVENLLDKVATELTYDKHKETSGDIIDDNGNKVGKWELHE